MYTALLWYSAHKSFCELFFLLSRYHKSFCEYYFCYLSICIIFVVLCFGTWEVLKSFHCLTLIGTIISENIIHCIVLVTFQIKYVYPALIYYPNPDFIKWNFVSNWNRVIHYLLLTMLLAENASLFRSFNKSFQLIYLFFFLYWHQKFVKFVN